MLMFTQQIIEMIHSNKGAMENTHKCTSISLLVVTNMSLINDSIKTEFMHRLTQHALYCALLCRRCLSS